MKILGIDPGSINCGYGLIEDSNELQVTSNKLDIELKIGRSEDKKICNPQSAIRNSSDSLLVTRYSLHDYEYISSGRIVLSSRLPLHARLKELYSSLSEVISEYNPDEIVIEKIFFAKSTKAALSLGHTRGVILLAASLSGLPIHEYSALEVKKAVVGYGRADKNQVMKMVREILKINNSLSPDSADAIAVAVCHANTKQHLVNSE